MRQDRDVNRDWALRLAEAGIAVLPCGPDKKPLIKWRKLSSSDPKAVAAWWSQHPNALPGIDLKKCDLVVLDGDRHGGPDGRAALRELLQAQSDYNAPATPRAFTPGDGAHVYFHRNGHELTNARGSLPPGIDVRGAGGYVVAPYAVLPDGRRYRAVPKTPDLISTYKAGAMPPIPEGIAALLARKNSKPTESTDSSKPGIRERSYALAALDGCTQELAACQPGGRNELLNALAYRMGRMVARGWLHREHAEANLSGAMHTNGYVNEEGIRAAEATLRSGLDAGLKEPHPDLDEEESDEEELPVEHDSSESGEHAEAGSREPGVSLEEFWAYMIAHRYIFAPTGETWPAASVNARIAPLRVGRRKRIPASVWLDKKKPVEQMTWAPGEPAIITGRMISHGGWIARGGHTVFNLYRPPLIERGNAAEADRWLDHIHKIYPEHGDHIVKWCAHRVQRPQEKINHALVLGGRQGTGKDSLLEPVKRAVGPWNFSEVSPQHLLGRFNSFLKSVILRINEARDLGEVNRYQFYDHLKAYTAAPPDVLRIDEKYLPEYNILNCCGLILTSNHKTDGIYLPPDDRRHFVAWSDLSRDDFVDGYWTGLWHWYDHDGDRHVAAYLAELDISEFDPKTPPPKTEAFWDIVNASNAPEEGELADVLDDLGRPAAITLASIIRHADEDLANWLRDRKNRRALPHRLERVGYSPVRNPDAKDGLWKIAGARQAVYGRADLSLQDRIVAAARLAHGSQ
jgi:hypothetical protein